MKPLMQFYACVADALRYRGIGDRLVQRTIAIIESQYADANFSAATPARILGISQAHLCVRFKRETGVTIGTYLRDLRLDKAAARLVATNTSIKQVWIEIGYRHDANFNHDFKDRFGCAPTDYRARGIQGGLPTPDAGIHAVATKISSISLQGAGPDRNVLKGVNVATVLLVDDDCRRETRSVRRWRG
jgi:AraC-like DNA-binding protein